MTRLTHRLASTALTLLLSGWALTAQAQVTTYTGTNDRDFFDGTLTGEADFYGLDEFDQVNYEGSSSDYTFSDAPNNQVRVDKTNGNYDLLDSIEGVYFLVEGQFYLVETLINGGGNTGGGGGTVTYEGTPQNDAFPGTIAGEADYFGYAGYDQVNYEGFETDYTFEEQSSGQVYVYKTGGVYDILDSIEGIWFADQAEFIEVADLIAPPGAGGGTITADDVDIFAFAGQSNAEGHFYNADGNNNLPIGATAFANRIQSLTGFSTETVNAAVGGSHSNNIPDPNNPLFWWNANNNQPTQLLVDAVADIQAELDPGQDLDGLIWGQGESDALSLFYSNAAFTQTVQSEFADATREIFAYFRNAFGADLPIYVQQLNDFDVPSGASFPNNDGFGRLRGEQAQIIADQRDTHLGATTLGLAQRDDLHFNTVAQNDIAEQLADKVVEIESAP